jgi:cytochrome c553
MSVNQPSWRAMWRQIGECAIMKIRHVAAIAVLGASCFMGASPPVLADDQKPANAQEGYAPPLNLLMVATQLSHFKLWYAGVVKNWPLANYELAQIRTGIDRASHLYPNNVQSNMTMMTPEVDEVEDAIKAKDSVKFSEAFSKLTAACNACHEATGFGFIRMRDPRLSPIETSPFSDESFSGH